MEQRINSNKKLSDQEKVELQQYITRIYGSLTTFNILFKAKKDNFKGDSSRGSE
jgi:superoxide dismutase